MAKSRTQRYYDLHPEARRKKNEYQKKFNKKDEQVKKRVELNAYNKEATKAGRNKKGDGKDAAHKGSRIVGYVAASLNRGDTNDSAGDRRARGKKRK